MSKLTTKWKELSKQRKKRAIPEGLTTKQAIGGWSEDKDFATTLHKVEGSNSCVGQYAWRINNPGPYM